MSFAFSASLAVMSAACIVAPGLPLPGHGDGDGDMEWVRGNIRGGGQDKYTSQAVVRLSNNLRAPYLLTPKGYRYVTEISLSGKNLDVEGTCRQGADAAGTYRCMLDGAVLLALRSGCREGVLTYAGINYSVKAWFEQGYHVGYLVYRADQLSGGLSTSHPFSRPVWVPDTADSDQRLAVELLAVVLNDMVETEESSGYPFLCGSLAYLRPAGF